MRVDDQDAQRCQVCALPPGHPAAPAGRLGRGAMRESPSALAAAGGPLDADELAAMDAYWRGAHYLSAGQIYLLDNPLRRQPPRVAHGQPPLPGHRGTPPGLNMLYVHW